MRRPFLGSGPRFLAIVSWLASVRRGVDGQVAGTGVVFAGFPYPFY